MHPSLPYILSSSDDMLIKLWDWEKGWICTQIFEGHSHYVMQASHQTTIACGVLPTDDLIVGWLPLLFMQWCMPCGALSSQT